MHFSLPQGGRCQITRAEEIWTGNTGIPWLLKHLPLLHAMISTFDEITGRKEFIIPELWIPCITKLPKQHATVSNLILVNQEKKIGAKCAWLLSNYIWVCCQQLSAVRQRKTTCIIYSGWLRDINSPRVEVNLSRKDIPTSSVEEIPCLQRTLIFHKDIHTSFVFAQYRVIRSPDSHVISKFDSKRVSCSPMLNSPILSSFLVKRNFGEYDQL